MKFEVNNKEVFASTGGRPFDKKKPLIVFIHGSGLSHITWVLQTRYFAFHGYSVLAIDLPGHGKSSFSPIKDIPCLSYPVNEVLKVLNKLEIKEYNIIGHSLGGYISLELKKIDPRCKKNILLNNFSIGSIYFLSC